MSDRKRYLIVLVLSAFAYFVAYPDDVEVITKPVTAILNLTTAISPSLYGVAAVGIIASTVVKVWGRRVAASKE